MTPSNPSDGVEVGKVYVRSHKDSTYRVLSTSLLGSTPWNGLEEPPRCMYLVSSEEGSQLVQMLS